MKQLGETPRARHGEQGAWRRLRGPISDSPGGALCVDCGSRRHLGDLVRGFAVMPRSRKQTDGAPVRTSCYPSRPKFTPANCISLVGTVRRSAAKKTTTVAG
ncbi:hypothetical protein MRX96_026310 [Rhipicephalus microplus]